MTAIQVGLRTSLKALIDAAISGYVLTTAVTEATYVPRERLEDLIAAPKIKLVAVGFSSDRKRLTRAKDLEVDVPIQVAIQQKITAGDTSAADTLVELVEQVMATCETDIGTTTRYSWLRTEPLRDENGLAYSYDQLMIDGVFQSIFTVYYRYLKRVPE